MKIPIKFVDEDTGSVKIEGYPNDADIEIEEVKYLHNLGDYFPQTYETNQHETY